MPKLDITKCEICGKEYKTPSGLMQHLRHSHNMKTEDYIVEYIYDREHPKCKCGCNENVTIRGRDVADYKNHHSDDGRFKVGETPKRDYDKWLKNVTKGIQDYNKKMMIEQPDYRSGENSNFYNKHHTEETKEKLRKITHEQIRSGNHAFIGNDNGRIKGSSLENNFEKYLIKNDIRYKRSHKISYNSKHGYQRYKYYDFYLPEEKTLIEIHGSYWHPKDLNENLSDMQIGNYKNDRFKEQLAKKNKYNLLVIYDTALEEIIKDNKVIIGNSSWFSNNTDCFYVVNAERVDVQKLEVEF